MLEVIRIRATRMLPSCWLVSLHVDGVVVVAADSRTYAEGAKCVVKTYRAIRDLHQVARKVHGS